MADNTKLIERLRTEGMRIALGINTNEDIDELMLEAAEALEEKDS
jgi:hypothetical protein